MSINPDRKFTESAQTKTIKLHGAHDGGCKRLARPRTHIENYNYILYLCLPTYLSIYVLYVVVGPSIVVCEIAVYLNNIKPGHHVKYYNVTGTIIIVSLKIYNLHNPIRIAPRRTNRPAYVMMMMIALFRIGSTPSPITNWTCRTIQFGCELLLCPAFYCYMGK